MNFSTKPKDVFRLQFNRFILLLGSILLLGQSSLFSQTYQQVFQRPSFRGKADTQWAIWDRFQTAIGNNSPDVSKSASQAVINQTIGAGVILTGGGNIYGINNPPKFILTDSVPYILSRVVLQVRIVGANNINIPGVTLTAAGKTLKPSVSILETGSAESDFGGGAFTTKFIWNVEGAGIQNYSIDFAGIEPHTSLDAVALDTAGPLPDLFSTQFDVLADSLVDKATVQLTGNVSSQKPIKEVRIRRLGSSLTWVTASFDMTNANWSIEMPLDYGRNIFQAQAIDSRGRKSSKTRMTLYRVLVQ